MSALHGDNVVDRSAHMPWFDGPACSSIWRRSRWPPASIACARSAWPVQRVVRPDHDFPRLRRPDCVPASCARAMKLHALPSGRRTACERIVTFDGDLEMAHAPMSVTLTLEDEIDISRGDMICVGESRRSPPALFEATVVWFDAQPLDPARRLSAQAHVADRSGPGRRRPPSGERRDARNRTSNAAWR